MKRFVYLKGVRKKGYAEQGEIFFLCQRYARQPARIRKKIDRLCEIAGGEYSRALFELMCTDAGWVKVCMEHHLSNGTLNLLRMRFYTLWR